MTNPMIRIHNTETNEIIDREMTAAEYADYEAGKIVQSEQKAAEEKAEADRAAAQTKLAALGLTAEDLKALGL
jgi:hypothetical protein